MKAREALAILESAYDLSLPHRAWLRQITDRMLAAYPGSSSPYAYTASLNERGRPILHEVHFPIATDPVAGLSAAIEPLSDEQLGVFYRPGTVRGSLAEGLAPMAELGSVDTVLALRDLLGGGELVHLGAIDAAGSGIHAGIFTPPGPGRPLDLATQEHLGVHLHSAMRLRKALGGKSPLDFGEAMFEADGKLAHAEGAATPFRHELERAVRELDASRSRTQRSPSGEGDVLEVWQGLVEGRWSLVDRIDTDGRRYYVAIVNPSLGVPLRALNENEAQVAAMAVAGEPNKTIAYAMGVAESTVANWIRDAMRKMGVASRADLIRVGADLLGGERGIGPV